MFWRCSGHSRGVLGAAEVFWRSSRCSGGVLGTAEVFWRCSAHTHGCSGGVLHIHTGVLEVFWTQGAHGRSDISGISQGGCVYYTYEYALELMSHEAWETRHVGCMGIPTVIHIRVNLPTKKKILYLTWVCE